MINIYMYPCFVLFSLFFIYIGVVSAIKFAGIKIKIFSMLIFFLLILRYLCLAILMTCKSIMFLYILKPFFYLNYLSIPMLSMVTIYIIMRNEKFQLKNIFVASLILAFGYFIILANIPNYIELSNYYGYKMYLQRPEFIYLFKVLINTLFLIFAINLLDKNHLDKKGIYLIISAALMSIIEIVLTMVGIKIFQENILSDFIWILAFIYALNKK